MGLHVGKIRDFRRSLQNRCAACFNTTTTKLSRAALAQSILQSKNDLISVYIDLAAGSAHLSILTETIQQ